MSRKITTEIFITRANIVHNNKYDYSKTIYIKAIEKVDIICPEHGVFKQAPNQHILGDGCKKCSFKEHTTESYIKDASIVHNNKYNYSKVVFTILKDKIIITCPIHGEFKQSAGNHLFTKHGCRKCSDNRTSERNKLTQVEYEERIKKELPIQYKFISAFYINNRNCNFICSCSKHGEFTKKNRTVKVNMITCPLCTESRGEQIISEFLTKTNIKYNREYSFEGCRYKKKLRFDFFLPDYNMCIEFDGVQHSNKKGSKFSSEFELGVLRDNIKNEYCQNNNIKLLRIAYNEKIIEIIKKELNDKTNKEAKVY